MHTVGRWALRVPDGTDGPPNVPLWMDRLAVDLTDVAKDNQGTLGARPTSTTLSPGVSGRYFTTTDELDAGAARRRVYRDAGTTWDELATVPVTARMVAAEVLDPALKRWDTITWGGAEPGSSVTGGGPWLLTGGPTAYALAGVLPVGGANSGGYAFYLDPADWAVASRTTKLRIRWNVITNAVAPGTNIVPGLYQVLSFGGASGAAPFILALSAVIAGSTAAFITPGATTNTVLTSSEFNAPAAGTYVFAMATGGAFAAGAWAFVTAHLQMRNV